MFPFASLEELLTSPMGFGLERATPLQRAICWALERKPIPAELWADPSVPPAFGNLPPDPGLIEFHLLCAIRSAKTLISVAATVWMAAHVDLGAAAGLDLRAGETPQISYVSAKLDLAQEAYKYLAGAFNESPFLASMMHGKPTADTLTMLHPSGVPIRIRVAALSAFGTNLVSRWCAGVIFDEAPRMASGADGYVLNLKDQVDAVVGRLLPGAWIICAGSPVGGSGYIYETFKETWPDEVNARVGARVQLVKAPGFHMNPSWWTPERCAQQLALNPDAYQSDVLANFRDIESSLFTQETLNRCTRADRLTIPRDPTRTYTAVMDPATRGNAWTLLISESPDNRSHTIVFLREWRGSKVQPLSPKVVLSEIRSICDGYGIETVRTDQLAVDFIRDIALDLYTEDEDGTRTATPLHLSPMEFTQKNKTKLYLSIVARADMGMLSLPPDPALRRDLLSIKKVYAPNNRSDVKIILPETPDGRHCDFAPPLAILCGDYVEASAGPAPADPSKDLDPYELECERAYWADLQGRFEQGMLLTATEDTFRRTFAHAVPSYGDVPLDAENVDQWM